MPLSMPDTKQWADDDPNWERWIPNPALAQLTPMPEDERQELITAMVTAATLDESYATLWIAQGIDVFEARKRLRDLLPHS